MKAISTVILSLTILIAACGGGARTSDTIGSNGNQGDTSNSSLGSATVILAEETYEFSTVSCVTGGSILISFEEGANKGSITSADPTTLIRLTVDGGEWVDHGSAAAPGRSGETFTWSGSLGELASGDEASADITVDC